MPPSQYPQFQVKVKESTFESLPIPNRVNKLIRGDPFVKVRRCDDHEWYDLWLLYISFGDRVETHFGKGWNRFMKEEKIKLNDTLEILFLGNGSFRVKVFRGGEEVPKEWESDVILLSSGGSSSDAGNGSLSKGTSVFSDGTSGTSSGELATTRRDGTREEQPEFIAHFTEAYIKVNRLNVPLAFAKAHLASLGPVNEAEMFMNHRFYDPKLYVVRERGRIKLCNIKGEGIKKMIKAQKIKKGERVVVKMLSKSPLVLKVSRL